MGATVLFVHRNLGLRPVRAVLNILTNAYYLQLFEPAISRKTLLLVSVAMGGAAFWIDRVGLRAGWRPIWPSHVVTPFGLYW